jgi:hypothetical protein
MVLPIEKTDTYLELKRWTPDPYVTEHNKEPVTPSQWFSKRFPRQAKVFGCPFIENKHQVQGFVVKVTPVAANHDFLAAILGGDDRIGPRVVYFEPDLTFYFQDRNGIFKPTTEEKLQNLLRAYLIRCAEELPANVEKLNLVLEFRSEVNMKTVIRRAKSILATDHSFFSVESQNTRQKGPEIEERMARQFVQHALTREPNVILTVTDAFSCYSQFLKTKELNPPKRELFKGLLAPIVREEFDLGLRNDLPGQDSKQKCGWKGLRPAEVNQAVLA